MGEDRNNVVAGTSFLYSVPMHIKNSNDPQYIEKYYFIKDTIIYCERKA